MNYAEIKPYSIENGTGVRVSLFVSGCTHHCKECFNPETWNFSYGKPFTEETEAEILRKLEPVYITGLTLLGGEPGEPENQRGLLSLLRTMRERLPEKNVWTYTGYLYEDFLPGGRAYCEVSEEFISLIDVLVDGPFILEKKDISLKFRGSANQRIIDVRETRASGEIVLAIE
ncbi:MAG: anaerobic ribonucleoside-triphosphate reductase activating protein [Clostridiales bacterium]|nr:anaerobic ribonucleoside-triphosphate reductase activating protein [Clostridiales bacterium]